MTLCHNCGNKRPNVVVGVDRYRDDGGASHREIWCLDCVLGKNPLDNNLIYLPTIIINQRKMGGEIHEADYPAHHTRPMYEIRQKKAPLEPTVSIHVGW